MKTKLLLILVVGLAGFAGWSQSSSLAGTLQVVHTIEFPTRTLAGYDLAWDGQALWTSFVSTMGLDWSRTRRLDPSDGSSMFSFTYGDDLNRNGHAWDGTHLWITAFQSFADTALYGTPPDTLSDGIRKFDPTGQELGSYSQPYDPDAITTGATWDGTYLWLSDSKHREIMRVDPTDMSVHASFPSPGDAPRGLAWDGSSLWCVDGVHGTIFQINTSGVIIETWYASLTDPWGITFDGKHLWVLDNGTRKILQLAVPEPSSLILLSMCAAAVLAAAWHRRNAARSRAKRP